MKNKTILLSLIIGIIFSLNGCSEETENPKYVVSENKQTTAAGESPEKSTEVSKVSAEKKKVPVSKSDNEDTKNEVVINESEYQ